MERIYRALAPADIPWNNEAAPALLLDAVAAGASPRADAALQALVAEARQHYLNAMTAQRAGDWARYGQEIRLLGDVLERIGARQQ